MKFSVKSLLLKGIGAKSAFSVSESLAKLDLPENIVGKSVAGKVDCTRLEETILVQADFAANVILICDRCLENFEKTLQITFDREYNINRRSKNEEELYIDKFDNIDLDEPIREEIILAVPMKNLCRENCLGICAVCGENINHNECQCHDKSKIKSKNIKLIKNNKN